MATWQQLADRMFPDVEHTPEEYEALYPPRALKEGARVTRIAPAPPATCIWACCSPPPSTG